MEPVRDLGAIGLSDTLVYNCDKANIEELKVVLEVIRDKELKKITFTTKSLAPIARYDVKTYDKAQDVKDIAFTGYVLKKVCFFIGHRVQRSLKYLNLEGIPLEKYFKLLYLNTTVTLTTVCLRHTRIGDSGCKKMTNQGLSSSITSLDLTGCFITSKGIEYLSSLIAVQQDRRFFDRSFHGLEHLCLDYNQFGDAGASIIIQLLMNDFHLLNVEMRNCGISNADDAVDLVQFNHRIQVLDLRGNKIEEETLRSVISPLVSRHDPDSIKYGWKDKKSLADYQTKLGLKGVMGI